MHRLAAVALWLIAALAIGAIDGSGRSHAQELSVDTAPPETRPLDSEPRAGIASQGKPPWVLSGYLETDWQWNYAKPDNGITNYRGFDNRANTITLSNVSLAVDWDVKDVIGKLALQVGRTPSTYYLAEPNRAGTTSVNATNAELWKYLQQAYLGYRFHFLQRELLVQTGVFLSPIGPETMIVHENWNWSRSNLFFALPFYHAGARASQTLSDAWSLTVAVYNGWNNIVDNNTHKSLSVQALYAPEKLLTWSLLYFGGVERPQGAPEGAPFRHLFDSHLSWQASERWSVMAHGNGGFERNRFGMTHWGGGALSARVVLLRELSLAARADRLQERAAHDAQGSASPILFPARWVSSATATLDYHPADSISFRLEYRHDAAASPIYFQGHVPANNAPNARTGNTSTVGATAWF